MNINQAYNKGLTDAENQAIQKLSDALKSIDSGPFANPQMEELRQAVLSTNEPSVQGVTGEPPVNTGDYAVPILLGDAISLNGLSSSDQIVVDILIAVRQIATGKSKSKVSTKFKSLIRDLEVDIIKSKSKS